MQKRIYLEENGERFALPVKRARRALQKKSVSRISRKDYFR